MVNLNLLKRKREREREREMELLMVCACAFMVLIVLLRRRGGKGQFLPPCPPGLPIIGHLHLLQPPLHHSLHKLSQTYGPIFFIMMGSSPAVVVSSPSWAKEFWHTHDREFADRPQFEASKRIFYNNRVMVMMEYGPVWRQLRKLYTVHILSSKRVEMFENPRLEEMALSIKFLESQASGVVVDLRKLVSNTVGNMMSRMLFSKRSFDASEAADGGEPRFKELVEETAVLFGTPFLGDLIPWLSWLDVQGARKRMDRLAKEFDIFFEGVLAERIATRRGDFEDETDADYLDMLLRIYNEDGRMDRDSIKCILMDLLTASIETTTTAIEWTLAELLNNPSCMKQLQEEVDTLLLGEDATLNGSGCKCARDSQLTKLDYLQTIIKETLRLHPPFALNFRQMCKALDKGRQVGDFYLPKKTRVIINLWAMARDTTLWGANADIFCPDRFFSDGVPDLRGQHYEFLPFGAGRRGCPGMNMALTVTPFVVANLVLMFNWEIPNGVTLDLSEAASSLSAPLAKPLVAIPTLRRGR